jgi:hypothetical protein
MGIQWSSTLVIYKTSTWLMHQTRRKFSILMKLRKLINLLEFQLSVIQAGTYKLTHPIFKRIKYDQYNLREHLSVYLQVYVFKLNTWQILKYSTISFSALYLHILPYSFWWGLECNTTQNCSQIGSIIAVATGNTQFA